jgi:peptidoglycan/LPS O-acetylase OafA/YrhL
VFGLVYRVGGLAERSPSERMLVWTALTAMIAALNVFTDFPYARLIFFPLGALLAELAPHVRRFPCLWASAATLGAVVLGSQSTFWDHVAGVSLMVGGCVTSPWLNRVAVAGPLTILARNSYAVYLTHGVALHTLKLANPHSMSSADMLGLLLGGIALVVALAMVTNRLAFEPFGRWLNAGSRKRTLVPRLTTV